ncbi:probable mannitol dehydrogenase [Prunus dulcis]|uniref:probable mannitol dehydrogenase n=1 Tax=Prunus dulcis TaxID=3755 RepID=UPI001482B2E5|nr:probable mannitol dehydrogenase [Prunus dulcis]
MALDEDGLLSSILEGESPGLDLVVDWSTLSKLVDQSTLDNSVPVDLSTCHNQPQNLSSSEFCARFQSDPKESHLFVVKIIIKYVSRTFEFGLLYTYDTCVNLVGYSDADWAGCSDGRKSTSGRVFYVTVISTSPNKEKEAIEHLHADSFIVIHDQDQMQAAMGTMDGIIDTVFAAHPLLPLIGLLKSNGKLVMVTAPEKNIQIPAFSLLMGRKMVAGSRIGGMKETQEMVDFAVKHNITADIEVIPVDYLNTAMERLAKSDVKYRFVIDIGNTLKSTS